MQETEETEIILNLKKLLISLQSYEKNVGDIAMCLQRPIKLDDERFKKFVEYAQRWFVTTLKKYEEVYKKAESFIQKHPFDILASEIKFIGKTVYDISKRLEVIEKKGVEQKVLVDVIVDGFKVDKSPQNIKEQNPLELLLTSLGDREGLIVVKRYGLLGSSPMSFVQISKEIGLSSSRVGQICYRAIRRLRHPTKRLLAQKLPPGDFRDALTE